MHEVRISYIVNCMIDKDLSFENKGWMTSNKSLWNYIILVLFCEGHSFYGISKYLIDRLIVTLHLV